jgi:hypothetical protein
VREQQVLDGDDLDQALLFAPMPAPGLAVQDRDLFPRQRLELPGQGGLVVLYCEQVVSAALFHQVLGVTALCVHGIGADYAIFQVGVVDLVQQRRELRDFVGFRGDLPRRDGDPVPVPHGRQHDRPAAVGAAGPAQVLAVHRVRLPPLAAWPGLLSRPVSTALLSFTDSVRGVGLA